MQLSYQQTIQIVDCTSNINVKGLYTYDSRHQIYRPMSLAYFCSDCGNLWARVTRVDNGKECKWVVRNVICRKCSKQHSIWPKYPMGGSIYDVFDTSTQLDSWDKELLERELSILLDNFKE